MIRRMETDYGILFIPDTDIAQYPWLELTGRSVEDEYICDVRDLLADKARGVVVDVGANFGCWTLALAGLATEVVAFEPQHPVRTLLNRSLGENKLRNVEVMRAALGSTPGNTYVAHLNLDTPSNFGGLSMGKPLIDQPNATMVKIPLMRLDDVVQGKVSFIKIDVEGMEMDVLGGAAGTILESRPLLFVESDHPDTNKGELVKLIEGMGYATMQKGPNLLCLPIN